ncbi:MAG: 4Fe-4S cluster-binding domain-containing protein, partial [Clostridiales bacterium]|nr:4Fe-4S cluster-binding domain-containing protein [Clostridiales bacterium]
MSRWTERKKKLLYPMLFIKYLFVYARKKVDISFVEVWVGQSCTLKCRECLHMIPYIPQKCYSVEELIDDCKRLFALCHVDYFSIVGGEPLTNRDVYKIVDFVTECPDIRDGKLITNGTVMPDENLLNSLKKSKGKLDVRIDVYPGAEEKAGKFYNLMQKNGIRSTLLRHDSFEEMRWKWLGGDKQKLLPAVTSQVIYTHCALKGCYSMA